MVVPQFEGNGDGDSDESTYSLFCGLWRCLSGIISNFTKRASVFLLVFQPLFVFSELFSCLCLYPKNTFSKKKKKIEINAQPPTPRSTPSSYFHGLTTSMESSTSYVLGVVETGSLHHMQRRFCPICRLSFLLCRSPEGHSCLAEQRLLRVDN